MSRRKFEKIVVSMRRTLSECPVETTLQFPPRKPNRLRCVSIGKGGFSFEFHKYLPFFISKRKNYAHPLRIPRETRSWLNHSPITTTMRTCLQILTLSNRNRFHIRMWQMKCCALLERSIFLVRQRLHR